MEDAERMLALEESKQYDGKNGRLAYMACKGKVCDVIDDCLWVEDDRQTEHVAGRDLTGEMISVPHGEEAPRKNQAHRHTRSMNRKGDQRTTCGNTNVGVWKTEKCPSNTRAEICFA